MSKTPEQEIDDKIEALQLRLIEENAAIEALTPVTLPDFMGDNRKRDHECRMHEAKRDAIVKQIGYLTEKKAQVVQHAAKKPRTKTTKQATVYKQIVSMRARNHKLTNDEAFERLANKSGDSEEAIRKAFYAEQKRLNDDKTRMAREKRDLDGDSDQQDQGTK
jgi:hypothetical protein